MNALIMHKSWSALSLFVATLLSVGALSLMGSGCGRNQALQPTTAASFSVAVAEDRIRGALLRVSANRSWGVVAEAPGQTVMRLDHGRRMLMLQVDYNAGGYVMTYLDSAGLGYSIQEGRPVISRHYRKYVTQLQRLLERELNRADQGAPQPMLATAGGGAPAYGAPAEATPDVPAGYGAPVAAPTAQPTNEPANEPANDPAPEDGEGVTCEEALITHGHQGADASLCNGVDAFCAVALLRAGHAPQELPYCQGVAASCAQTMLEDGMAPAELNRCR